MSIKKTQVKVDVTGEQKAIADVKKVDREVKKLGKDADVAKRKVESAKTATKGGRFGRLLERARARGILKEESFVFGGIELGRDGFRIEEEFKKGKRGTGLGASALKTFTIASLAGHGIGGLLNKTADLLDFIEQNKDLSVGQIARELANGASQSLFEFVGVKSIVGGIHRLSGGDAANFEQAFKMTFGDDSLDREILAQQNRNTVLHARALAAQLAFEERQAAFEKQRAAAVDAIDKAAAGLSAKIARPGGIKLDSRMNARFQQLHKERVSREASEAKARLPKTIRDKVEAGEGR